VALVGSACEEEQPPPVDGFLYAALGDSFTAAPDLPTITTDGCHRSDHNYPHLVAKQIDDVRLTDVSCGGARTDAVLGSQKQESEGLVQPAQIGALSPETDLVTVGFGANDLDFVVTAVFGCLLLAQQDPDGAPCKAVNAPKVPRVVERIQDRLVETLEAIANRSPDARLVVVGYPRLFEEGSKGCPKIFPIATGDVPYVQDAYDQLNEAVEAAADEADAEFIDVAAASEGHDMCSDDPWVNGKRDDKRTGAAKYHPMPAEQKAVAKLILELVG
jgi:lysophospholipase L1-like esterase